MLPSPQRQILSRPTCRHLILSIAPHGLPSESYVVSMSGRDLADGYLVPRLPLWIQGGAIRWANVEVDGQPVRLIFPTAPKTTGSQRVLRLAEPMYQSRRLPGENGVHIDWGNLDTRHNSHLVKALRFVAPLEPLGDKLPHELPPRLGWLRMAWIPWYEIVQDWLAAWTGLLREQWGEGLPEPFVSALAEMKGLRGLVSVGTSLASHGHQRAATGDEVRAAFVCAGQDRQIPPQWALLVRARSAHFQRRYRDCVIDACTASESSISEWIQAALARRSVPVEAQEVVTKQANGIIGLAEVAASLGLTLPRSRQAISNELAGPRNRAVHAGAVLDVETATKAFRLADSLVATVAPMPTPASILRRRVPLK